MLIQLTHMHLMMMFLYEHRVGRHRWIRDFTLQSVDPGEY
jgi:hypothetical protein